MEVKTNRFIIKYKEGIVSVAANDLCIIERRRRFRDQQPIATNTLLGIEWSLGSPQFLSKIAIQLAHIVCNLCNLYNLRLSPHTFTERRRMQTLQRLQCFIGGILCNLRSLFLLDYPVDFYRGDLKRYKVSSQYPK